MDRQNRSRDEEIRTRASMAHEFRVTAHHNLHTGERCVRVWEKPKGRDWRYQDLTVRSDYGPLSTVSERDGLILAIIDTLHQELPE